MKRLRKLTAVIAASVVLTMMPAGIAVAKIATYDAENAKNLPTLRADQVILTPEEAEAAVVGSENYIAFNVYLDHNEGYSAAGFRLLFNHTNEELDENDKPVLLEQNKLDVQKGSKATEPKCVLGEALDGLQVKHIRNEEKSIVGCAIMGLEENQTSGVVITYYFQFTEEALAEADFTDGADDIFPIYMDINQYANIDGDELACAAQDGWIVVTTATAEGSCGENMAWDLSKEGTLTLSGSGNLEDELLSEEAIAQWNNSRKTIESVVLDTKITGIGKSVLAGCDNLTEITIMNPKCVIADSAKTVPEGTTIVGYEESTADAYARKYNRPFTSLGKFIPGTYGDFNGDGKVKVSDAQQILGAASMLMLELDPGLNEVQQVTLDVNGDGKISMVDAQYTLIYAANTMAQIETNWAALTKNPNMPSESNLKR